MKVLMINKFLWAYSGTERYMFDAAAELRDAGHEVAYFGMADPRNIETAHGAYHVSPIDYRDSCPLYRLRHAARIVGKTVYSFEARRKLAALLRNYRPDIAHLHSISHHISPSILYALRDAGVPVVQTIHDYKLVCPGYSLFDRRSGEPCERCLGGAYHHCAVRRCVKGSLGASVLATGAQYLHRAMRIHEQNIDLFLCSTQFLADKLIEGGVPGDKIRRVPLTLDMRAYRPQDAMGDYIVCVGRLVREKGVATLIRAMTRLPQARLLILGDGEDRPRLESLATSLGAGNVEFLGYRPREEVARIVGGARFLVQPSELYETCGLAVWEAFALGRPAVASRIGGLPESVVDGETGFTFTPGDADDLSDRLVQLFGSNLLCQSMGQKALAWVERVRAEHLEWLTAAYDEAKRNAGETG